MRSLWPVTLLATTGVVSLGIWYFSHPVAASSLRSTIHILHTNQTNTTASTTNTAQPSATPDAKATQKAVGFANSNSLAHDTNARSVPSQFSATTILDQGYVAPHTPEGQLIEILSFIEQSKLDHALLKVEQLIQQQPNFQLAHLVHGDLLQMRAKPNGGSKLDLNAAALNQFPQAQTQLEALRAEAKLRVDALLHRPPEGTLPSQVLSWSGPYTSHLIAVDASRSRLYWFENQHARNSSSESEPRKESQFRLIGDFYVSVGKAGTDKRLEGDGKTPLGLYFITSARDGRDLPDLYGSGALPLNYPNALDRVLGKTGYGIWLHGTPSSQFVRAPLASDGCVVIANPDMAQLLQQTSLKTTPVIIAERLDWVLPSTVEKDKQHLESVIQTWQQARSDANAEALDALIAPQFLQLLQPPPLPPTATPNHAKQRKKRATPLPSPPTPTMPDFKVKSDVKLGIADVNLLHWQHPNPSFVAVFEETVNGQRSGVLRQQYWWKPKDQWQLLQDTTLTAATLERPTAKAAATAPPPTANTSTKITAAPPAAALPRQMEPTKPTPSPVAAATAATTLATAPAVPAAEMAIEQAVHLWAKAWSQKDMNRYFGAYASDFDPPKNLSRSEWEKERRERILPKTRIEVELSQLRINQQGQQATVHFVQHYRADALKASSKKTLKLVKHQNRWLITEEAVGG